MGYVRLPQKQAQQQAVLNHVGLAPQEFVPERQAASAQPAPAIAHDFARIPVYGRSPIQVQTKLTVSAPGDQYEQEADRVAESVMTESDQPEHQISRGIQPKLARMVLRPEDIADSIEPPASIDSDLGEPEPSEEVQRSAIGATGTVTPQIEQSVQRAIGRGGESLPTATQSFMEGRFGWDFSSVRVHHDAQADTLSRGLNARAFTLGNNIFFARSEYQPESPAGRRLLAHELTHVVQQSAGRLSRQIQRATRCSSYNGYDASVNVATYNCAGLALRTYRPISPPSAVISAITANFINPQTPTGTTCAPGKVKFWLWEYDIHMEDDQGTIVQPTWQDFHIVAGRFDSTGQAPTNVYSKNGRRPVYGPGTGPSFRPPTRDRATSNDANERPLVTPQGRPVFKVRSNMSESPTCATCHL